MAKKSMIISATGESLESTVTKKSDLNTIPKVVGVKPCGSQVLVEILTEQEKSNSSLYLSKDAKFSGTPQGYVVAAGPNFKSEDYGFKVGDRVILSGSGVMAPNYDNSHRERLVFEPYVIKSVLVEL